MGAKVSVSTQTPDYESEVVEMTREEALEHFSRWPWQQHRDRQLEMESAGEEACPPNMSFGMNDRCVFVVHEGPGVFDLHINYFRTSRRFGLFKKQENLDWDVTGASADVAARFIEAVFVDDDEEFISFADSNSTGSY